MYRNDLDAALEHIRVQETTINNLRHILVEQRVKLLESFLPSKSTFAMVALIFVIMVICLHI